MPFVYLLSPSLFWPSLFPGQDRNQKSATKRWVKSPNWAEHIFLHQNFRPVPLHEVRGGMNALFVALPQRSSFQPRNIQTQKHAVQVLVGINIFLTLLHKDSHIVDITWAALLSNPTHESHNKCWDDESSESPPGQQALHPFSASTGWTPNRLGETPTIDASEIPFPTAWDVYETL